MFKSKKIGLSLLGILFVASINNTSILSATKNDIKDEKTIKTLDCKKEFYITGNLLHFYKLSKTENFKIDEPVVFCFTNNLEDNYTEKDVQKAFCDPGYNRPGYGKIFALIENKLKFDHWKKVNTNEESVLKKAVDWKVE